jgi:hypothetical protein
MRTLYSLCFILLAYSSAWAQSSGPSWRATIKVIDENHQPVAGATVAISYYVHPPPGQSEASEKLEGVTDNYGMFTASHTNTGSIDLGFKASKGGYYATSKAHEFAEFNDNDPAKWNPSETLVLKQIINPIPMYAKRLDKGPPVLNQAVGYDLMVGDWVAPYGRGKATDIIFTKKAHRESGAGYEYKVTVGFPNAGDGIQEYIVPEAENRSDLRSPHEAPLAGYQNQLIKERYAHPGQPPKSNYHENANYFLRVRTALDDQGHVKSALYGKIYGEFTHIAYYLNPTPNDRNIEFDPKQNLLKGLKSFEQIKSP